MPLQLSTAIPNAPRLGRMLFILLLVSSGALPSARVFAHGDEIKTGADARGPVKLSAAQRQAIGLQTVAASTRTIDAYLDLNGEVQVPPDRQVNVSTRISGQAKALYATLGESVRAGQALVRVESRLSGNPPPSVTIAAPIAGIVDARNVMPGQSVEPDTVLFHISDRRRMLVVAKVYEEDLGKITLGQAARVQILSYPQQLFNGKITLIDPNLNALSRTVSVWIELDNPQDLLKPNMFARASVILSHDGAALSVPSSAIIEANGERFVFVAKGQRYERVEVETGSRDGQFTQIIKGLTAGDAVVTQGNRELFTQWLTGGAMKDED